MTCRYTVGFCFNYRCIRCTTTACISLLMTNSLYQIEIRQYDGQIRMDGVMFRRLRGSLTLVACQPSVYQIIMKWEIFLGDSYRYFSHFELFFFSNFSFHISQIWRWKINSENFDQNLLILVDPYILWK